VVTFPLLFGIMFGDVGHGLMLLAISMTLVALENRLRATMMAGEVTAMLFSARYLLVAMSLCAVYVGLLYNDFVSVPMGLFASRWLKPAESQTGAFATKW
jgi:V-type H+-transporting ATPase subunit a